MSQHDYDIANQTAPNFRTDLNNALDAIVSKNSGTTEPSVTYANQWWYDNSSNILKIRSEADDAWINVGYLDQSINEFKPYVGPIQVDTQSTSTWEAGTSSQSGIVSPSQVKAAIDSAIDASGGFTPIASATASGDAAIDFTAFDNAKYDSYVFVFSGVKPSSGSPRFYLRTSTDGGSSFDAGISDYAWVIVGSAGSGAAESDDLVDNNVSLVRPVYAADSSRSGYSGKVEVKGAASGIFTAFYTETVSSNSSFQFSTNVGHGVRESSTEVDAIRFAMDAGNIASGTITMFGRTKA